MDSCIQQHAILLQPVQQVAQLRAQLRQHKEETRAQLHDANEAREKVRQCVCVCV